MLLGPRIGFACSDALFDTVANVRTLECALHALADGSAALASAPAAPRMHVAVVRAGVGSSDVRLCLVASFPLHPSRGSD